MASSVNAPLILATGECDRFLDQFNIHPRLKLSPDEVAYLGLDIFVMYDNLVPDAALNVAINPPVPNVE